MLYSMTPGGHQVFQFFAKESTTRGMDGVILVGFLMSQPNKEHWERSNHHKME